MTDAPKSNSKPGLTRRHVLAASAGALATPALFGTTAVSQIRRGDKLVVGIWGGAQHRIVQQYCEAPLREKYGITVEYVLGGTPERRARAYAELGRPSFDLLYLNIFESRQAVRDGVTQAPKSIPGFDDLYDIAKIGGYGVAFNPVTVVYDRRKVSAPITSWRDLWREDVRRSVAWPSFPGAQGTAGLVMAARIHGGNEQNMDQGFRQVAALKPFPAIQSSQQQIFGLFDQQAVTASIEFGSFTQKYADATNPNVIVAAPTEGQVIALNVACPTVGTANQALVEEWIALHLASPCQIAFADEMYYSPTNRKVVLPPTLQAKTIYGEAAVRSLVDLDWDRIIAQQAAWTSRFNREIAG